MSAPQIDKRDMDALLKQIREMVPFYTPEWKASEESDPGLALLRIFAKIISGVVGRLNQVPDKNFIAFLNMLGLKLLPANQARAPVTFSLSTGTVEPVLIPEGTQVASEPPDGGEPIVFRTEKNMMATPAKIVEALSIDKEEDVIFQAPPGFFMGRELSPYTGFLLGVGKDGKSIFLADTTGLEQGDIVRIDKEYSEIHQVLDSKVLLKYKLKESYGEGTALEKVTLFELLTGLDRQEHSLYLGHNDLFNIKGPVRILLDISGSKKSLSKLANQEICTWQYWNEDWIDLDVIEDSLSNTKDYVNFILRKREYDKEIKEQEINGVNSRWIRCVIKPSKVVDFEDLDIDRIKVDVRPMDFGVEADLAFHNDIPLNTSEFYPFGRQPRQFDIFYLACQEAFSKKGSSISINFILCHQKPEPGERCPSVSAELSWEYWNGKGWIKLPVLEDYNEEKPKLTFRCPEDITQVIVNGQMNYWIRSRLVSGNYGREEIIQSTGTFELKPKFCPPIISKLKINYSPYQNQKSDLEQCFIHNNLKFKDRSEESRIGKSFKPFYSLDQENQALYLGFDRPPLKGPISLYFSLDEQENYIEAKRPKRQWEYFREQNGAGQWERLKVLDRTNSLTQSGTIEFIGPMDFFKSSFFGNSLYWIRAINTKENLTLVEKKLNDIVENRKKDYRKEISPNSSSLGQFSHLPEFSNPLFSVPVDFSEKTLAPKIKGIFLNTTLVSQAESIKEEIIGSSDGKGDQSYVLTIAPVLSEEIYVNEINSFTEKERRELVNQKRFTIKEAKDEKGDISEFWVKWKAVYNLKESTSSDRHYEIDRTFGVIQFGDGIHGAIPPIGTNNLKVNFQAGGGAQGNVGPQEITTLQTSIAFVDSVSNPEAAEGGFDTESVEQALRRGPKIIKHRDRAVTVQDFESLAVQASRNVSKVKCLPHTNNSFEFETGWVSVIIVPESKGNQPQPSYKLKQQVEAYLRERAANVVVPKHFLITGPVYAEVSIKTELMAVSLDSVPVVENEAVKKINEFLHPLSGGHRGQGWEFGRVPSLSDFYVLLQAIEDVDRVEKIEMTVSTMGGSQIIDVTQVPPYSLVSSGRHHVHVNGLLN